MSDFFWAVGIEDTNVGWPVRGSGSPLDEYELTQHDREWRDDLQRAADAGANAIRWGAPWYRVNPEPGVWDWSWCDQVIDRAVALGLEVILDLVHYGTPTWLRDSFTDPAYPDAVADYAGRAAHRYRGRIRHYTPLNEPLVTASFTGARGIWPPYGSGDADWARVVVGVADGIQRSARAIRAADPDAVIVHVEATHLWSTVDPSLSSHLEELELRNYLPTDLVLGRVDAAHELHPWLLDHGVEQAALDRLRAQATRIDVIGLNYYPELSARELIRVGDQIVGVAEDGGSEGLVALIRGFAERYGLPILVSETAVEGDPQHLVEWMDEALRCVLGLRAEGVELIGVTWWPLFDFVDWSWASDGAVVEEFWVRIDGVPSPVVPPQRAEGISAYLRPMGLYRLRDEAGLLRRDPTAAVDRFRQLASALPARLKELERTQAPR